jgi:hypothetical protein
LDLTPDCLVTLRKGIRIAGVKEGVEHSLFSKSFELTATLVFLNVLADLVKPFEGWEDGSENCRTFKSHVHALGKPFTPYLAPKDLPAPSASTLAMTTLSLACAKTSASSSYVGARF